MIDLAGLTLAGLSRLATGGLVAAVWQGALLSVLVALVLRLLPKTPASVRFAIWFGVFAVVAALPMTSLVHAQTSGVGHAPWVTVDSRWCQVIAGVWGMASLMRAVTLMLAVFRVRALWKRATPLPVEGMCLVHPTHRDDTAMNGAPRIDGGIGFVKQEGVRRAELCVSDEVDRPTVIGFFAPKILIPAWLVEKLTAGELEQIVLHEAGHLSRADDWLNLLQKIGLVVFPLNPALAWVERRLCFERELACDERVLQATRAPKAYAACLASLAEHRLGRKGLALALGALGRESELGRRVGRILRRGELMRPMQAKLVLGGAMLALLTAAAGLERCPQVVGFAATETLDAAMPNPAAKNVARGAGGMYQAVMFHEPAQPAAFARGSLIPTHAARLHSARGLATSEAPREMAADYAVPAVSVFKTGSRNVSFGAKNVVESRQGQGDAETVDDAVVQWVVVTSWRREDGARMVLTSAQTADAGGHVVRTQSLSQSAPEQIQDHPYAAVPVRDGWLVFQL
jgi:hypothetical protein